MAVLHSLWLALLGFAGGLSVGAGFVAFITVLGIIPRLMQLTKTYSQIRSYEASIIFGVLAGTAASFYPIRLWAPAYFLLPAGLASGMFIGMLAAALTEVLNVFPLLAKRIGMKERVIALMMAVAMGKIAGSLFHWVFFISK